MDELKDATSKLSNRNKTNLGLINKKPNPAKGKSFRFKENDLDRLQQILEGVKGHREATETDIVKALIWLGSKMKSEKIAKAIKEIK